MSNLQSDVKQAKLMFTFTLGCESPVCTDLAKVVRCGGNQGCGSVPDLGRILRGSGHS
jgi:hypothetical protein